MRTTNVASLYTIHIYIHNNTIFFNIFKCSFSTFPLYTAAVPVSVMISFGLLFSKGGKYAFNCVLYMFTYFYKYYAPYSYLYIFKCLYSRKIIRLGGMCCGCFMKCYFIFGQFKNRRFP